MSQQKDPNVQKLAALNNYLKYIMELCPQPEEDEDALVLVLVGFVKTLERRISERRPTIEWNQVMRWSVVESNQLLDRIYDEEHDAVSDWNPALDIPQNPQQQMAAVLMTLIHELIGDIAEAEGYLRDELKMSASEYAEEIINQYEAEQQWKLHERVNEGI